MPYGAHETMEIHECLMEKINVITHFNLYAKSAKNPQLLDMIVRHQQEEIRSYNEVVACAQGNSRFAPIPPNTAIQGINNRQIQYGLNNPPSFAPQSDAELSDEEIALAMLLCHKNAARNCTQYALECADPNLRMLMLNCAATCTNQAYEVFLFMNQQGVYQVPTLNQKTEANFLQRYQPASESLETLYGGQVGQQAGQNAAYTQQPVSEVPYYGNGQMTGSTGNGINDQSFVGSENSVLYGANRNFNTGNPMYQAMIRNQQRTSV